MTHTEPGAMDVIIATLIAVVTVILSLGTALILNLGSDPLVGRTLGTAWAWAVGGATIRWWVPWAKQAVPPYQGGDA